MDDLLPPYDERLQALLGELEEDVDDREHANISISHWIETTADDWSLSVYRAGTWSHRLIWEEVEHSVEDPRHLKNVSKEETLRLMKAVASGDLATVEEGLWKRGVG